MTQEGYEVEDNEPVYEILYKWYNPEVSMAEPYLTVVEKVPKDFKMWKHKNGCLGYCIYLNRKNHPYHSELKLNY